jgi:hypothetical protein
MKECKRPKMHDFVPFEVRQSQIKLKPMMGLPFMDQGY